MDFRIIDDNKDEFFLKPIPKWITVYGFAAMVLLGCAIVTIAYFFKIPKAVSLEVHIMRDSAYALTNFDDFQNIGAAKNISLKTPNKEIVAEVKTDQMWIQKNTIFIPIVIDPSVLSTLRFKTEILCVGKITIENSSLIDRIFVKKY
jgi:hypothetical protein